MKQNTPPKVAAKDRKTVVIKRYQNRKLYDTENSTYVTLDDISQIIRRGDDVKVVDNKSKEDLTSVTLTQIIFEEEKKNKTNLPLGALKKIIQGGGDTILDIVSKTTEQAYERIHHARENAESLYGKIKRDEDNLISDVLHKTQNISKNIEGKIKSTVDSLSQVASLQNEVRKLRQRIHYLEKKLKVYERK